MNSKKFILFGCVVLCVFAAPAARAQMMGHGAPMGHTPVHGAPMLASPARTPMQGATTLNRASGFHRFNNFDRHDRFHHFNRVIIIDNFGFPFFASFPFYYPYPYPYPYPCYGYPYDGYGSYGYGAVYGGYGVNGSVVVQVQRRLASAGYYSGPIDGIVGSGTRRAIRAYERNHGLPADGVIHRRLLATMGLA